MAKKLSDIVGYPEVSLSEESSVLDEKSKLFPSLRNDIKKFFKQTVKGVNTSDLMVQALMDYIRLMDRKKDADVGTLNFTKGVLKAPNKNRWAATVAKSYDLSPRKFIEFINREGTKMGLNPEYMIESMDDQFEVLENFETINEMATVSQTELNYVKTKFADKFRQYNVDFDFSRHFIQRVNDIRNQNYPITAAELEDFFHKVFDKLGKKIGNIRMSAGIDMEGVFTDRKKALHIPFVIRYDQPNRELDLLIQTVIRKKKFVLGAKGGKHFVLEEVGDMIMEMSEPQKKKKEKIVKGMKKSMKDLKDRYGDDWESVMYATATKRAVEDAQKHPVQEEHGAGMWGTKELTQNYKNATPGQEKADTPAKGNEYIEKWENDDVDPGPVKKQKIKPKVVSERVKPQSSPTALARATNIGSNRGSTRQVTRSGAPVPATNTARIANQARERIQRAVNRDAKADRQGPVNRAAKADSAREQQRQASKARATRNVNATAPGNRPSPSTAADLNKAIDREPQRQAQARNAQAQTGMAKARAVGGANLARQKAAAAKAQQAMRATRQKSGEVAAAQQARQQGANKIRQTQKTAAQTVNRDVKQDRTINTPTRSQSPAKRPVLPKTAPAQTRSAPPVPRAKPAKAPVAKPAVKPVQKVSKIAKRPTKATTQTKFKSNFKGGFGQKATYRFNQPSTDRRRSDR